MKKVRAWISAARLRTLPLSVSGIFVGTAIANSKGFSDGYIFIGCLLITILFQITSNFANDYGDGVKGTDDDDRLGPVRAFQSGILGQTELKFGIFVSAFISLVLSIILLGYVFGNESVQYMIAFLILSLLSIWAAIKYTVGNSAYGYRGLGDVFVFLFFGLLAVLGTAFLYTQNVSILDFLPATAVGLLCVGVLNLNNLRDMVSDEKHGKITLVVKLGFNRGKQYHVFLLTLSLVLFLAYYLFTQDRWSMGLTLLPYIVIFIQGRKVIRIQDPKKLDPELKKLALATFAISVLLYVAINYFL